MKWKNIRTKNNATFLTKTIHLFVLWFVYFLKRCIESNFRGKYPISEPWISNSKCEYCANSFTHARSLRKHIYTIHEGHKDYKCESCEKSFSRVDSLKNHIHTIHEGHRFHKCNYCDKSFSQAGSLKKHMLTIHKETYQDS